MMSTVDSNIAYTLFAVMGLLLFVLLIMYRIFRSITAEVLPAQVTPAVLTVHKDQHAVVAMEEYNEEELMTDHVYDGIRELDNNLPKWWQYMFYGTIIFSVVYMIRFYSGHLPSQEEELASTISVAEAEKEEYRRQNAALVDETTVTYLEDAGTLSEGKSLFDMNCMACHGAAGEGVVGPNLTDAYWINGGSVGDIFKTIKYGVPEKGMKSWQAELKPLQIQQVTSYIMSLSGTNPSNAKAPQGELYESAANAVPDTVQQQQ